MIVLAGYRRRMGHNMFKTLTAALVAGLVALGLTAAPTTGQQPAGDGPHLLANNQLAFPEGYREWVFLSAGLGMTYGPNVPAEGQSPSFTNVYVNPSAYRAFMKTGAWPDRTMFVLEIRGSASEGSINRAGRFQTGVRAIEANVKDARLPGGWGFYNFGRNTSAAGVLPQTERCYSCHAENTAVEHTFVQFYPSLMEVAQRLGTVKKEYGETPGR
jgi:hypothetical protein